MEEEYFKQAIALQVSYALNNSKAWIVMGERLKRELGIDLWDLDVSYIAHEIEQKIADAIIEESDALEYNINRETLI